MRARSREKEPVFVAVGNVGLSAKPGLGALKKWHADSICYDLGVVVVGSVDLDDQLEALGRCSNQNRWDYGIGCSPGKGKLRYWIWVEFHHIEELPDAEKVRAKADWLRGKLKNDPKFALLRAMTMEAQAMANDGDGTFPFQWIAQKKKIGMDETNAPLRKILSEAGVELRSPPLIIR